MWTKYHRSVYLHNPIPMKDKPPSIYWNKTTGKNTIVVPCMSKVIMKELYTELKHPEISQDDAVIKIWLSELTDQEKIIIAVNIGAFKARNRRTQWLALKWLRAKHKLESYKKHK